MGRYSSAIVLDVISTFAGPALTHATALAHAVPTLHAPTLAAMGVATGESTGPADATDWVLLAVYLGVALGFSFLCSMLEAGILSIPRTHITVMKQAGKASGVMLDNMRNNIDTPLAAILTLNTFAHTIGSVGAGLQIGIIFGNGAVTTSAGGVIITLLILYFSEIIPKSLGAIYAKPLAPFTAYTVRVLIWITYPFVLVANALSGLLGGGERHHITREEVAAVAELGEHAGVLQRDESRVIRNLLRLTEIKVSDVMTPRSVAFMLQRDTTVAEVVQAHERLKFSRIPVYDESPDHVIGLVQRHELHRRVRNRESHLPIGELVKPVSVIPETASVGAALNQFVAKQEHLFQVVDEFGGTAGIITLEDCVETLLGVEIVDETDSVKDMRELARQMMEQRRARRESLNLGLGVGPDDADADTDTTAPAA